MDRQNCKRVFPRILTASCSALSSFHALTSYVMGISPVEAATLLAQGDKPTADQQDFVEQTAQEAHNEPDYR